MSLNETISNLGDSIINLVNKKRHGTLGLEQGDVGYDKEVWSDIYKYKHSTFDKSKFTVVGSPTITDDGIASGFSTNSYLRINTGDWSWSTFVISCKFTTSSDISGTQLIYGDGYGGLYLYEKALSIKINYIDQSDAYHTLMNLKTGLKIQPNTTYYTKLLFDGTGYKVLWSVDGVQFTQCYRDSKTDVATFRGFFIGKNVSMNNFKGRIYLNYFSIVANGVEFLNFNKTGIDQIKKDNYTVVGSPVISDDGVASGFSDSDYLEKSISIDINKKIEAIIEFTYDSRYVGRGQTFLQWVNTNARFTVYNRKLNISGSPIAGKTTLVNGNKYSVKVIYQNGTTELYLLVNGVWSLELTDTYLNFSSNITGVILGNNSTLNERFWGGSIDLNSFKIYVDGNLVYQPCLKIPYTESKAGSKVVDAAYRDRVIDMYEQEGQAGYYTIQEDRKENFTIVGSPTIVNGVASGFSGSNYVQTQSLNILNSNYFEFISPIYKFNSVQPISTVQNLFISGSKTNTYIECWKNNGGYLQFQIRCNNYGTMLLQATSPFIVNTNDRYQIKIQYKNSVYSIFVKINNEDFVLLNSVESSELVTFNTYIKIGNETSSIYFNGQIDLNAFKFYVDNKLFYTPYIEPNYTLPQGDVYGVLSAKSNSSEIARYSMPSDKYIDLTLGASGSTYTAPANGYFTISKLTNGETNQNVTLMNTGKDGSFTKWGTHIINRCVNTVNGVSACTFIPASKGDIVKVIYTAGGTLEGFRFIYAEGEV